MISIQRFIADPFIGIADIQHIDKHANKHEELRRYSTNFRRASSRQSAPRPGRLLWSAVDTSAHAHYRQGCARAHRYTIFRICLFRIQNKIRWSMLCRNTYELIPSREVRESNIIVDLLATQINKAVYPYFRLFFTSIISVSVWFTPFTITRAQLELS